MGECHNEILMNIPDEHLEQLADMYREHPEMHYASSILTSGKEIRTKRCFLIRFMSPGNCWREDGTFFVLMEFPHSYELAAFTLDKSCKNVYEGLMKTKRLYFERPLTFSAVHSSIYPTVMKVIQDKKLSVRSDNQYYIYTIPKTAAIDFETECCDDIELNKLELPHSNLINSAWSLKFQNSEELINCLIEMNGGYGIFLKSTGELVAWAVKTSLGQLGMVQTVEEHQRKGYASLAIKALSKEIADDDEDPTGTVEITNESSQKAFEKLGFVNLGVCNFINLEKAN